MAFGYRYWMVFLQEIEPHSFLLFVHNPAGATKLRSYASGRKRIVGKPGIDTVFRATEIGSSRHECDPHKTDDHSFWYQKTQELNRRYLGAAAAGTPAPAFDQLSPSPPKRVHNIQGRARRGSQRQLQDYVNDHPDALSQAILDLLPNRMKELGARIRWVSPLARDAYREYRDADFLTLVGLADHAKDLAEFWPSKGPSWDALGIISDPGGRMKPGVILVEAKSHILRSTGAGVRRAQNPSARSTRRLVRRGPGAVF